MKGESRDTTHNLDLLWCDRFAPRQKVSCGIALLFGYKEFELNFVAFLKGRSWYTQEKGRIGGELAARSTGRQFFP